MANKKSKLKKKSTGAADSLYVGLSFPLFPLQSAFYQNTTFDDGYYNPNVLFIDPSLAPEDGPSSSRTELTIPPPTPSPVATSESPEPEMDAAERAEQIKEQGNVAFKAGKYGEAIDLYTKAMGEPLSSYHPPTSTHCHQE